MKTFIWPLLILAFLATAVVLRLEASTAAPAHEPAVGSVIATAPLRGHAGKVLERACRDCHSNQTSWPWYSHVPPASWMIQRDVDLGRRMFDFTDWSSGRATPTKDQMSLSGFHPAGCDCAVGFFLKASFLRSRYRFLPNCPHHKKLKNEG